MPLTRTIDVDFAPAALIRRIVAGALEHDPVRMHGAIVAAFEIHGAEAAERDIFIPARRLAHALDADRDATLAGAIDGHGIHAATRRQGTAGTARLQD
jgi:hypothetical protein